jgi:hypothetical protein
MIEKAIHEIKNIPESKKSKHLWIVLLKDLGDYALYFNKTDNCFAGFEVHKIRIRKATEHDIKCKDGSVHHLFEPLRRAIAGNEDFGKFAWHYPNLSLVYEKYPEFKKYSHEIETRLRIELESIHRPFLRVRGDKTIVSGSDYCKTHQFSHANYDNEDYNHQSKICTRNPETPY